MKQHTMQTRILATSEKCFKKSTLSAPNYNRCLHYPYLCVNNITIKGFRM